MRKSIALLAVITFEAACVSPPGETTSASPESLESPASADSAATPGISASEDLGGEQGCEARQPWSPFGPYPMTQQAGERLAEAQQPFTPFGVGLALAIGAVGVASGFDCQHHPQDVHCWKGTGFILPLLGIIAAVVF